MEIVWVVILGLLVAGLVSRPFWGSGAPSSFEDPEVAELEAARDAKFREIRDAETDFRTGKIGEEEFEELNSGLRAEAAEIIERLDRARERAAGDGQPATG